MSVITSAIIAQVLGVGRRGRTATGDQDMQMQKMLIYVNKRLDEKNYRKKCWIRKIVSLFVSLFPSVSLGISHTILWPLI